MIKVERFINQLMTSNCYIVVDEESKSCLVIDPGSVESKREIDYINTKGLTPDYIIVTHEHTDHNWGVNALREVFPKIKFVCSEDCSKNVAMANKTYFLFYYDDPTYSYEIKRADILIKHSKEKLDWCGHGIMFYLTPGHSFGSMCVKIDDMLFTGDTIMPFPPYFNGRDSNRDDWNKSIKTISKFVYNDTTVYPGHGNTMLLSDWYDNYVKNHILFS